RNSSSASALIARNSFRHLMNTGLDVAIAALCSGSYCSCPCGRGTVHGERRKKNNGAALMQLRSIPSVSAAHPRVLIVGAFPSPASQIFGGMVTSCRALLASTLPTRVELDLLDSTQARNPPPPLPSRIARSAVRFLRFIGRLEAHRPDAVLLFVADGASIVEKGAMAWYARVRSVPTVMLPRAGSIVNACNESAFTRWSTRFLFRGARKIVCQSEVWRDFAIQ